MSATAVLWIVVAVVVVGAVAFAVVRWSAPRTIRRGEDGVAATRARALMGRAVVAISDATRLGAIDDVLFDASGRDVVAFRVKGGPFSRGAALERDDVAAIGPDAIMVAAPAALNEFKRLPALDDALRLDRLRGTRVVTEGGELLGTVSDLEIDGEARYVQSYVLRGSATQRLRHRQPIIPVGQVTHRGDSGLLVVAGGRSG
ncbi:MAG TPA: PRC-barrel domain-containing protein [Candidatus Angelobacter sp.]|jgi:uncharacterized protein YrrD|nr:PRC-barrel domain-containing protein [Candidatus Angelobacter sp.]